MKVYDGMEVYIHAFLSSPREVSGEFNISRALSLGKDPLLLNRWAAETIWTRWPT